MNYPYRKNKRLCAHWLLGILCGKTFTKSNKEYPYNELWAKSYFPARIGQLHKEFSTYSIRQIYLASLLLLKNGHITLDYDNGTSYDMPELTGNLMGEEAFLTGYYLVENDKDFVETIQSKTSWIIPLISIGISMLALIISLFNACNKTK